MGGSPDPFPSRPPLGGRLDRVAGPMSQIPMIGLAHGSRHPDVAAALAELMAAAGELAGVGAHPAFLDLTEPDLEQVAAGLAADGIRRAVVVPLLFTSAFHAEADTPDAVRVAAASSGVELAVADILGTGDDVLQLLSDSARLAGIDGLCSILLYAVGSARESANAAVRDLTARLAAARSRPALAAFGTMDPRPEAVARQLPEPIAVVPLFLSPGLLLEPMAELAARHGWPMAGPIGVAAAPLIADRYRNALATQRWG
jgi:sirohydrochlorin cobaltochelatase